MIDPSKFHIAGGAFRTFAEMTEALDSLFATTWEIFAIFPPCVETTWHALIRSPRYSHEERPALPEEWGLL